MKSETLNITVRGRNLGSLRLALADGTVRHLRVFDAEKLATAPEGEPVIESITLAEPEKTPA